jgi:hypothetical protein
LESARLVTDRPTNNPKRNNFLLMKNTSMDAKY